MYGILVNVLVISLVMPVQCIMVPDLVNEELMPMHLELGNRSEILTELTRHREECSQFLISMACINSFLQTNLCYSDRSSVLISNTGWNVNGITDSFMIELRADIGLYVMDEGFIEHKRYNRSASAIVLTENANSLTNMTSHMESLCGRDCQYLIIITEILEDTESFLQEANSVVEIMWTLWIVKVIVFGSSWENVMLAGSVSFKSGEMCAPSEPKLLDVCDKKQGWKKINYSKSLPMNKCVVNVAFYENLPYTGSSNDSDEIIGFEGSLVETVVKSLDADISRDKVEWGNVTDIYEDLKVKLHSDDYYDLIFGGISWSPQGDLDFTVSYDMVRYAWMIPTRPNVSLKGLIAPFTLHTWLAVLLVLTFGSLVKIFCIRETTFLDLSAILFQVPVSRLPTRDSTRINFISWVIFSFFLAQFYLAALAKQLLSASNVQIETMKELVSSGYVWGGTSRHREIFSDVDDTDEDLEDNEIIRTIYKRFTVFEYDDYVNRLADLLSGRNTTLALVVMLNATTKVSPFDEEIVHVMSEIMGSYPLSISTWVGNPFLMDINKNIQYLIQTGFVQFWAQRTVLNGTNIDDPRNADVTADDLGLEQLIPGFLLLAIGYGLGFIMILIEIAAYPTKYLF
ncbi:uncharacterized protein [Prorops nasuta]|uniref:uncharacterized protein n=1 Tax=Prorops nasuta TaxID=863751 RepID=UPI0034CE3845